MTQIADAPASASAPDPAPPVDKAGERIRSMFGSIAHRYDLLNHLLSLNIDRSWRRFTTRKVPPVPGLPILDCCTGTADLALEYDRASGGQISIVASDFCHPMLEIAARKVAKARASDRIRLVEADTQRIPAPDGTFGVVCVAFGLRNVADTIRGLDELIRVASQGGKVAILEFSKPKHQLLGRLYMTFFKRILPRVGQTIAPNSYQAYKYLPTSVLEFPEGEEMARLMRSRGLLEVEAHSLTLGVATLYVGRKA